MKKKLTLVVTCVVLVAAMVIGGTLAYFTDTQTATNTFTMGNVQIKLDEAVVTKDGDTWTASTDRTEKGNNYGDVYPGAVLPKDPTVHNRGENSAYIRAKVTVKDAKNVLAQLFSDKKIEEGTWPTEQYKGYFMDLVGTLGEGWTLIDVTGYYDNDTDLTFVFKYSDVLAKGESTSAIFQNITIPANYDGKYFGGTVAKATTDITIVAEAMQVESFSTWEAAFTAFDAN